MCHWPFMKISSQCLRLTTFDLNPMGASDGSDGLAMGIPSRSEYRPTRITQLSDGRVRDMGIKVKDGREFCRGSWYGKKRMVGFCLGCAELADGSSAATGSDDSTVPSTLSDPDEGASLVVVVAALLLLAFSLLPRESPVCVRPLRRAMAPCGC